MTRGKDQGGRERSVLSDFFEPEALAVLGSFKENYFGGYVVLKSLLAAGYSGGIYPVNPRGGDCLGLKIYGSLRDIPAKVDLALVMINARSVAGIVEECGDLGIRAVLVVADGFAERDGEGRRLQEQLAAVARKRGVRIIGPNTAGILNTSNGLNPAPYEAGYYALKEGSAAIISQTGMINPQAVPYPEHGFGLSKLCDLGNKCDLDECDVLEYLARDPRTRVISVYLESIKDGSRFLDVCRKVVREKPVLVLKAGRTGPGARATASHTGSMAVNDAVFDAACNQAGLLRLESFGELFELPKVFAGQPLPGGNRMGILTITGGVAVMCIDRGGRYGLELADLQQETGEMLDDIFPGMGNMPVDIGPMMASVKDAFSLYPGILDRILEDPGVDSLLSILWANPAGTIIENYLEAYARMQGRCKKPVVTWVYGPQSEVVREVSTALEDMGFPVFREPETCVKALGLALQYARFNLLFPRAPGASWPPTGA